MATESGHRIEFKIQSGSQIIKVALAATFSLQLDWTVEPSNLLTENYPVFKVPLHNSKVLTKTFQATDVSYVKISDLGLYFIVKIVSPVAVLHP